MKPEELQFIFIALVIIVDVCVLKFITKSAKHFIQNSIKAKAKVVAIEKVKTSNGVSFKLSVIFNDQLGSEVSAQVSGGSAKTKEGDEIDILYLKTDSKKVKMGNFAKTSSDLSNIMIGSTAILIMLLIYMVYSGVAQIPSF